MKPFRIIVVSDTHGRFQPLYDIVEKRKKEASLFLHLGDGEREMDDICTLYPDLNVKQVRGNCDFGSMLPLTETVIVHGKKILMVHGHAHSVKYSLDQLKQLGQKQHADILLYGHTHESYTLYENGQYILCPGSPVQPRAGSDCSYGMIDITDAGIVLNIVKL